jgi:hypothetical protein
MLDLAHIKSEVFSMNYRSFTIFVALLLSVAAHAQKKPPTVYNLVVSCTCTDTVGKSYARALRDLIATSPRYEEITDSKENQKRALLISVVTLPLGDDSDGSARGAAISVVFVFDGTFVEQYVQTCGENAKSCAQKTFDSVDAVFNSQ